LKIAQNKTTGFKTTRDMSPAPPGGELFAVADLFCE
jgi:hypothetical protein